MFGLGHIAPGAAVPDSVHGVSVSIPDIASVIGFEGRDEETRRRIPRGYPRFRVHEYVARVADAVAPGRDVVLVRSARAAEAAARFGASPSTVFEAEGIHGVEPGCGDAVSRVRDYVEHTGCHLSSREAEDWLFDAGLIDSRQVETSDPEDPERVVADHLADAYGAARRDVSVHNSGMSAVHATTAAIADLGATDGRHRWIHLGWIFFDTVTLVEKRIVDGELTVVEDPFDAASLERIVAERGHEVAGIVAEVPSNPLLQTPDIAGLADLARRARCPLVLDATIATPYNVDILGYADVVCESLTKYASGAADVLMGVAVVNSDSPFADELRPGIERYTVAPYDRDAARMADHLRGYEARMERVNANAMALAQYFQEAPAVRHLYWAYEPRSAGNYKAVARRDEAPGGLLLLDLAVPLETVYDRLALPKGPSFGAEFTMASAQVFVAYFDLLSSDAGRARLRARGLHRDMVRVSVGTEEIDAIQEVFDDAFAGTPAV